MVFLRSPVSLGAKAPLSKALLRQKAPRARPGTLARRDPASARPWLVRWVGNAGNEPRDSLKGNHQFDGFLIGSFHLSFPAYCTSKLFKI